METINQWFEHWEPIWLALILLAETVLCFLQWQMLRVSYFFDKEKMARYKGWKAKPKEQSLCTGEHK